ncbi:MAG: DUF134 domain-containing protein [Clostridia bacterium]|nr:DUF134 domain-containing protein [Clostridia bacterium]
MPRPKKWRKVCSLPAHKLYGPRNCKSDENEIIEMEVEEFETIRLMDFEGLNQTECAEKMNVARSTVQRIYDDARKKMADSLVNGKLLKIEGGNYVVCTEEVEDKCCPACHRRQHRYRGGK